jgi:hypothetical protein
MPLPATPPVTEAGIATEFRDAGTIAAVLVTVTDPDVAVILTEVGVSTTAAVSENVAEVSPSGTTTGDAILIAGLLAVTATITPPAGAGPVSITRFDACVLPPGMDAVANVTVDKATDAMVTETEVDTPAYAAVTWMDAIPAPPVGVTAN